MQHYFVMIWALIRACHPGPTLAVTLAGTGLALASGRGGWVTTSVFITVLLGQLSVGWSNDAFDSHRDARAGRVDKPTVAGLVSREMLLSLAAAAAIASSWTALFVGEQGIYHILAVGSAWLYNRPLKHTALSVVPFAVSFSLLVAYADAAPAFGLVAAGALLGAAAHFANVLPDLDDDAATGVRGLPHRLGAVGSQLAAAVGLVGSGVLAGYQIDGAAGVVIVVLSAVLGLAVVMLRPGRRVFRVVMTAAVVDVAALLVAVAN